MVTINYLIILNEKLECTGYIHIYKILQVGNMSAYIYIYIHLPIFFLCMKLRDFFETMQLEMQLHGRAAFVEYSTKKCKIQPILV